ncbi:MAG: LacI family DNA-binding transcriptional regulator [Lachnospiraceae bacterium]|nr:LacI family DNA-binding transcriptional regulator [Lachnospiraceae bacterium]MDD3795171.1 LacI family DNA-binding transcriptional regulator [Lachnospiraceae bacterium]
MTSREFAKLIGVSQSTVSRALNNSSLVTREKREYILQKAKEYDFELNSQAQSLRTRRTGTIGILFPKHFISMNDNLMLAHIYDCIQQEMSQYDYDIMVIYYDRSADDFSSFERIIRKKKVDGFLVLRMELSDNEMELIQKYHVPCVFMMNVNANIRDNLNYFFSDSFYGGYLAGKYFGKFTDYRKIYITVNEEKDDARRRFEGYRSGLEECGYIFKDEDILKCNISIESACRCVEGYIDRLAEEKTAIFTYSDLVAIGALQALEEAAISIPGHAQLLGMDDIPLISSLRPKISTVHVETEEIVPKACSHLMDLIEKKEIVRREWIKPRLVIRDTTYPIS